MVRDAGIVARFELAESLRSRRALVLLMLHIAGSVASTLVFIEILGEIEAALANTLGVAATSTPGTMSGTLMKSDAFLDVVTGLVGNPTVAAEVVAIPPVALFYGATALFVVPVLVALGSSDVIAAERATGSIRYALFRTDRTSWVIGKFAGQAALLGIGIAGGAAAVWVTGLSELAEFDMLANALWLARLGGRAWIFGLCWLGITLGVSQLTRSVHWARGLAVVALMGAGMVNIVLQSRFAVRHLGAVADTLHSLTPAAQRMELWRPDLWDRLPPTVLLVATGGAALALGHRLLLRADA